MWMQEWQNQDTEVNQQNMKEQKSHKLHLNVKPFFFFPLIFTQIGVKYYSTTVCTINI